MLGKFESIFLFDVYRLLEDGNASQLQNGHGSLMMLDGALKQDNIHGTDRESTNSTKSSSSGGSKHLDVEELEMLLEAYFVQIDGTLNKLSAVCCCH